MGPEKRQDDIGDHVLLTAEEFATAVLDEDIADIDAMAGCRALRMQ